VRDARLSWIAKTEAAVKDRLDQGDRLLGSPRRGAQAPGAGGQANARLNSNEARKRADESPGSIAEANDELKLEAQISVAAGGPRRAAGRAAGVHREDDRQAAAQPPLRFPVDTQASAASARAIVMEIERSPRLRTDRPRVREARLRHREPRAGTGKLRFIEVKGACRGADTITVTKNEILYSLNKPDDFILAIVEFLDGDAPPRALRAAAVPARAGLSA
jgi:hypothetical protein